MGGDLERERDGEMVGGYGGKGRELIWIFSLLESVCLLSICLMCMGLKERSTVI